MGFLVFVFWFLLMIGLGAFAARRDRSVFGWLLFALIFTPLMAFVLLALVGNKGKRCLACGETMRRHAAVCGHCGRTEAEAAALVPVPAASEPPIVVTESLVPKTRAAYLTKAHGHR